jgi:hypothetical protein
LSSSYSDCTLLTICIRLDKLKSHEYFHVFMLARDGDVAKAEEMIRNVSCRFCVKCDIMVLSAIKKTAILSSSVRAWSGGR